ncbi:helix-turn-helix domain-containing protein [Streptomyces sp. PA03-6a]|nr:helix-turn-helix domain-containing protein [Streptomyces sp. PA03-6a]
MVDPRHATEADHHDAGNPDAPTTHSFPAQLRRLRRERGLSLADLARRTHSSKGYLSKIETGAKRATVDRAATAGGVGATVVGAVGDGTTRLWDVHSGRQTGVLAGHTDHALGVALTSDGA